jgi:O-antigen/teichoic acid export membrane protein
MLARSHGRNRQEFVKTYAVGTEALLAFILPVTAITLVLANPMVRSVYAAQWNGSAAPLRLLSIALVLMALSAWNGFVLLSADRQRMTIRYGVAAMLVSLAACAVLLPTVGYIGGAVAAIIANVVSATWSLALLRRHVQVTPAPQRILRVFAANVGLAAVVLGLTLVGVPWWVAAGIGLAVYPLLLSALRVLKLRYLASLVRTRSPLVAAGGLT